jgi:hypothetical protein
MDAAAEGSHFYSSVSRDGVQSEVAMDAGRSPAEGPA